MAQERPTPVTPQNAEGAFGFTERERLFDRVSHERLMALVEDEATTVHKVEENVNNYGEFVFITMSRPGSEGRVCLTFWGSGYHEFRERWLVNEWFWYDSQARPETLAQEMEKDEVRAQLEEQLAAIRPYTNEQTQTRRGRLFEMLADLTDEDGAWSEMEDLPADLFDEWA
jgi:hypothetical protein